jgi:thioredoxin-dependent peroxiredoxin
MADLKVGDRAPDFTLMDEKGQPRSLKDYLGKKVVVLYFYPKDFTSGCTVEAKSFRDDYGLYEGKGAAVIGVSLDTKESHAKFSEKHNLPFPLLSDSGKEVAKAYGVLGIAGISTKRVTFVINKEGIITSIFTKVDVKKHSAECLKAVAEA